MSEELGSPNMASCMYPTHCLTFQFVVQYFPVLKGLANHLKTAAGYVKDYSKDDQLKNMANHFYNELDREFERQDRWVDLKDFGGLPKEKLNALRQRDKIDAPTQLQVAPYSMRRAFCWDWILRFTLL